MATPDRPQEPASPRQAFTFYAAKGRVYASNVAQKLIDLGALAQQADGWCYLLDGNTTGRRASKYDRRIEQRRAVRERVRLKGVDDDLRRVGS